VTTDFSVAPEIAQLAEAFAPALPALAAPRTDGRIAGDLADLAATPERWWDLVRFDARGPVRISVPDAPGTWLLILPPGTTVDCDCHQATALAGEAVEISGQGEPANRPAALGPAAARRPLRPGHVRVHGTPAPHRVRSAGPGYSVTLHYLRADHNLPAGTAPQRILRPGTASFGGRPSSLRAGHPAGVSGKSSSGVTRRPSAAGQNWDCREPAFFSADEEGSD
jgi:hypothetical protein